MSLRLARRDVAAHRVRSLLVAVLVGLPVLLMVAGLTLNETASISPQEAIPGRMGAAQAAVVARVDRQVRQSPVDPTFSTCSVFDDGVMQVEGTWVGTDSDGLSGLRCTSGGDLPAARPLPGARTATGRSSLTADLGRLTGGRVVATTRAEVMVRRGVDLSAVSRLGVDGRDPVSRGMVELTGGRWPAAPGEVLVTPAGVAAGMPVSGPARIEGVDAVSSTYGAQDVTVVGTVEAAPSAAGSIPVGLVALPTASGSAASFLIDRQAPVTWDDVRRLDAYGFVTLSRTVVEHPPADDPEALATGTSNGEGVLVALFTLGLLIESCLLAGPAFAVMAQRQRRTLALVAANGGTRTQVRHVVVAEAVVLGVVAAVAGAALGVAAAFAAIPAWRRLWPDNDLGPFDVPLGVIAAIAAVAVVASVVSALVPAAGLSRLDVVAALRRDPVSPRVRRGQPVLGAILAVGGGVTLPVLVGWHNMSSPSDDVDVTLGLVAAGLALVIGVLLLVPALLAALGRGARSAPVVWRIALRDAARQRGRTVPTVAATMAGAILLAGSGLVLAGVDHTDRERYAPRGPLGSAIVEGTPTSPGGGQGELERVARASQAEVPGARVDAVGIGDSWGSTLGQDSRVVLFPQPGCTPAQVVGPQPVRGRDCGTASHGSQNLVVVDPAFARSFYGLSESAARALTAGRIVTSVSPAGGGTTVTAVRGVVRTTTSGDATWLRQEATYPVPITVDPSLTDTGDRGWNSAPPALISVDAWRRLGGQLVWDRIFVTSPAGPITGEQESALRGALVPIYAGGVTVERGYESPYVIVMWILFPIVALLIVVAAVIATTLAMGEARRDFVTLGAIGAADGIRRRVAAAQAGVLALLGTLLGLAVGSVPGAALARSITETLASGADHAGHVPVPWLAFGATVVLTPLIAAGCAALLVPARPDLARRDV